MTQHVHVFDLAGTCTGPGPCDTSSFGAGKNWVNKVGGLPNYIRAVAHAFRRKGLSESESIQRAVGVVKNWAEGKGGVTAATRARAAKAVAEWEAKKAASHALTASPSKHTIDLGRYLADRLLDLAADPVAGMGYRAPTSGDAHRYHHGWIRIDASAPTAVERATRAVTTDGHALLHGGGMVPAAQRVIERMKAAGHAPTVKRLDVAGTPHLHIARTGTTSLAATPSATVDLTFTESLHPRNKGKFAPKGSATTSGGAASTPAGMAANVRDFQRRMGLPVTGVIDATTAARIRAELAAKGGRGRKGSGKTKARNAAAAAKRRAKAATRAQRQQTATHVATVNAMTPAQRATTRARMPIPPTGYVWSSTNTLRRFHA